MVDLKHSTEGDSTQGLVLLKRPSTQAAAIHPVEEERCVLTRHRWTIVLPIIVIAAAALGPDERIKISKVLGRANLSMKGYVGSPLRPGGGIHATSHR